MPCRAYCRIDAFPVIRLPAPVHRIDQQGIPFHTQAGECIFLAAEQPGKRNLGPLSEAPVIYKFTGVTEQIGRLPTFQFIHTVREFTQHAGQQPVTADDFRIPASLLQQRGHFQCLPRG